MDSAILLKKLREYGADIDGAMARFLDDEELYAACYDEFINDACFGNLETAVATKDHTQAFDAAHALKGVAGNMGLTPMYVAIGNIVEPLRAHEYGNLQQLLAEVQHQHEILRGIEY